MKKVYIILLSLVTAAMVGCGGGGKITKENFEKIKEGMTKAEVVAILGEPTGTEVVAQFNDNQIKGPVWQGSGFKIVTMFSDDGKLSVKRMEKQ